MVNGIREAFLDEGVDEQVLQELRMLWESKLTTTKAVDNSDNPAPGATGGNTTNAARMLFLNLNIFFLKYVHFLQVV